MVALRAVGMPTMWFRTEGDLPLESPQLAQAGTMTRLTQELRSESVSWLAAESHLLIREEDVPFDACLSQAASSTSPDQLRSLYVISDAALEDIPVVQWHELAALAEFITA